MTNQRPFTTFQLIWLFSLILISCRAPSLRTGPKKMEHASASAGKGSKYQCPDVTDATDPWLIESEPTLKVRIQSRAQKGVLLVKYTGCNLEVLYGCEQAGQYEFTATTRSKQTEYIRSQDELFAKVPIGALKLAGEFQQGDLWALNYVLVGTQDTSIQEIDHSTLSGKCAEATHFVQGMAVGAYELTSQAYQEGSGEVTLRRAGGRGASGGKAELVRSDGLYEKCTKQETQGDVPACQAIVQLFLKQLTKPQTAPVAVEETVSTRKKNTFLAGKVLWGSGAASIAFGGISLIMARKHGEDSLVDNIEVKEEQKKSIAWAGLAYSTFGLGAAMVIAGGVLWKRSKRKESPDTSLSSLSFSVSPFVTQGKGGIVLEGEF